MELNFELELENKDIEIKKTKRAKEAQKKHEASKFEPSWEQVWNGYENPKSKKWKKGIFELKNSDSDLEKLREVKLAVENGELGTQVENMSKFSKSHALKVLFPILQELRKEQRLEELVNNKPDNYYLVDNVDLLDQVIEEIEQEKEIGFDTETTGLDTYVDRMVGFSVTCPTIDKHYYIPFGHTTGEKQLPEKIVLQRFKPIIESHEIKKVLHNAKFDAHMCLRHGMRLNGIWFDTQIAMQLLNENEPSKRLKDLATKYKHNLGIKEDSYTFDELFGSNTPFSVVPLAPATVYASKDTHITYKLYQFQLKHLKRLGKLHELFFNIEQPLIPVVVDMERKGMLIDQEFAKEYGKELSCEVKKLEKEIKQELGDININSPAQLQKVFYDDLKLPDVSGSRKTDKPTLKILAEQCEVIDKLLKYKDLFKLLSTYIEALPEKIKEDGRIHGQFNQDKTDTGRFSSNDPNLQNLPSRARRLVKAPDGSIIVGIDFSQIEPRVLAHITGDEDFKAVYINGQDLYSTLASRVFKKPIEECGDGSIYRKMMKTGLLAVMYGTSMFTLSKQLGISVQEASQFIKDFFKTYPKVKQWIESIYKQMIENEYVETLWGRKRRFPHHAEKAKAYDKYYQEICERLGVDEVPHDFWDKKYKDKLPYGLKKKFQAIKGIVERQRRQGVNHVIQGSSADIMKLAMLKLDNYLKSQGWFMIGTVHDEVLSEISEEATHEQLKAMVDCLTQSVELSVPLKCDTEIMKTWGVGFKFDYNRKVFFSMNEKTGELLFETPDLKTALKEVA